MTKTDEKMSKKKLKKNTRKNTGKKTAGRSKITPYTKSCCRRLAGITTSVLQGVTPGQAQVAKVTQLATHKNEQTNKKQKTNYSVM